MCYVHHFSDFTCSLPQSLHLSQPTQSMIRDMFLKCARNSFWMGERITPSELKEVGRGERKIWGFPLCYSYTHGHKPSVVVKYFQWRAWSRQTADLSSSCVTKIKYVLLWAGSLRALRNTLGYHKARQTRFIVLHQCLLPVRPATQTVIITFQAMIHPLLMAVVP